MNKHFEQTILIVDDEPDIRRLLTMTLERMGYNTQSAADITTARQALANTHFQLCLTDLKLPDGSGIELVQSIQQDCPQTPVIVITAHGSMDSAIQAMKYGAFDFINKPVDINHLRSLINNALKTNQRSLKSQTIGDIVGQSTASLRLKDKITRVSRSQAPVFIFGESGSGKELVARAIHKSSSRNEQAFIAVNCGAIPEALMESEFFGHVKGSFTGAHQNKQGLFEAAAGGTLFLDEIADLPMDMQVKLLRTLQEKTLRPVGGQHEISVNVRILSATHKDLLAEVNAGNFRNDLYYRINVIDIFVPPLRDRSEDIPLLSEVILKKIADKNQTAVNHISHTALQKLQAYSFPGNIRELENILERASALCDTTGIDGDDLHFADTHKAVETAIVAPITASATTDTPAIDYDPQQTTLDEHLDKQEKVIILNTLEKNRWNRTHTARMLGITFRSLRYRMKKLGIDDD
ncbi:MAG: sigma-54 dependent transcriptional regulator [Cellvibrionaceae bacterium]|nr:sigma-54 dependent transcriptional regulator [Cellvibrionaceae bacterium]